MSCSLDAAAVPNRTFHFDTIAGNMNDLQKTESTKFFSNDQKNFPRDISSNLLMAKFLGQHSKEDNSAEMKEEAENKSSSEFVTSDTNMIKKLDFNMWHSVGPIKIQNIEISSLDDSESVHRTHSEEFINERSGKVFELLSQFKTDNKETTSKKFLAMSSSPENCLVLRQSGCLPLLMQLIHGPGSNATVRKQASQALHSIIEHNTDEKQSRREGRILNLIEQLLEYCEDEHYPAAESPAAALCTLMKFSFDMEQRITMCQFGALHALAKVIQVEHVRKNDVRNLTVDDITIRRYAAMSLTNLTCGDSTNKALLCSMEPFMFALVAQLQSPVEELCQVTAGVIRNLSWRADTHIKEMLHRVDATKMLMQTVMRVHGESTLRAILAALWNLSAHGDTNKVDICNVDRAIEFLVRMLTYQAPSGSFTIIESVGGILRNISKLIAVNDDFRIILRNHNCLSILLQQLKSPSLVIVGNACGTLWNLTARSTEDQCTLIQLGAIDMLRSLTHSKHKMISISSTAALKNLMSCPTSAGVLEASKPSVSSARKPRVREHYLTNLNTTPTSVAQRVNIDQPSKDAHDRMNECAYEEDDDKINSFRKIEEPYNVDDTYSNYTETDLDQPTNYSLKFSEHAIDTSVTHTPTIIDTDVSDRKVPPSNEKTPLETPLMFSRSSSINSISVCGEPIDDQDSVISEFSRDVSGIVSPSDLPGSPSDTVPPTPLPQARDKMNVFPVTSSDHVFEDEVTVFKEERTPTVFSVATSLSSLTFDDDTYAIENRTSQSKQDRTYTTQSNQLDTSTSGTTSSTNQTMVMPEEDKDDSLEVDLSLEEQQAILEACIVSGKPSSTARGNSKGSNVAKKTNSENVTISSRVTLENSNCPTFQSTSLIDSTVMYCTENTVNYCTEDTPISISHATSNSDLSLLCPSEDSFLQNSILPLSSCLDSVELSIDEQENLLNQCIAKGKQSLSYNSNQSSLEDNKSSQSSTLSEITEDLPMEDRTLIKDMTANGNLISSITTTSSITDGGGGILDDVSKDFLEEEEKNLLNECIALGKRSMKDSSDLENIGPPSFLAEANLDSSLTNVEEITDYPPHPAKFTPKQKRRQIKERYNTYTLKQQSPTKMSLAPQKTEEIIEIFPKNSPTIEERRLIEKDRFKTRTISKNDIEEIVKCSPNKKQHEFEIQSAAPTPIHQFSFMSPPSKSDESSTTSDNDESLQERVGAKIIKPVNTKAVKSGIPVVSSKLPITKSSSTKKLPPSELPVSLQRQNTFTKEESSSIPVRRESAVRAVSCSSSKVTTPTSEVAGAVCTLSPPFKSGIPSRITSVPKVTGRINEKKSPDVIKNHRWSMSENNLNSTSNSRGGSNTSLNSSSTCSTTPLSKGNPSASQSALPVRRESAVRHTAFYAYK